MTLREAREAKELSRADMARMLHVHTNTIAAWETGRNNIPQSMFERVVKMLDVNPDDLDITVRKQGEYRRNDRKGKYEAFAETLKLLTDIQDKSITSNLIDDMLNSWKKELSDIAGIKE